jgi:hypothetical protein
MGNNGREITTMIAAISMIRRLNNVSLGGFRRHWLDVHGPLVCTFDGLRSYMHCHPIASPAMNARARSLRIDGFPILFFDNHAERARTRGSPALAALDVDSTLFIGAVARIAANVEVLVPEVASLGRVSALLLYADPADAGQVDADAGRLMALRMFRRCCDIMFAGRGRPSIPRSRICRSLSARSCRLDSEAWSTWNVRWKRGNRPMSVSVR